jgi:hypothetical protein
MCVYNVDMFEFRDGFGYLVLVTVCQFVNSLFRDLGSIVLSFVSEEDLEKGEEIQLQRTKLFYALSIAAKNCYFKTKNGNCVFLFEFL